MITPSFPWRLAALLLAGAAAASPLPAVAAPAVVPRFTHPGAGQTFYFVLTDRFANGRTDNDTGGYAGGPGVHGFDPTKISHYHGGDFAGLTAKLDYLKNLGITAVWLTPPLKNKPMQSGTAGYHGYWITDFTQMDPHLGTNDEFRELVSQAHARGMKVFMDIITNHTADVIQPADGQLDYVPIATAPYRDAEGREIDVTAMAFNGQGEPKWYVTLSAEKSFARRPTVPEAEKDLKVPAWLNDVTLYHNRGNTTFTGENSVHGDFVGLDDLFTEHPRVVTGLAEIYSGWLQTGVDGYRIDTMRHVNNAFWQGFLPAIRAEALSLGRPDFLQFGEVYNDAGDPSVLSEFSTGGMPADTTLDFGFFVAARKFVSQAGSASALGDFFLRDDWYTDHDSNIHSTTTFLGNHDAGRFAYFLQQDNPGAAPDMLADLSRLGHGLLLLSRGQPVIYYGDEQGMIGRWGNDMQARESMFASQAPDFRSAPLLATTRTGADDKFDPEHPFYHLIAELAALRAAHPALRTGSMIPRATGREEVFAFSRIERGERIEYLAVFNNSRTQILSAAVPTSQPPGAKLGLLFASRAGAAGEIAVDAEGRAPVALPPLQFAVWRAVAKLGAGPAPSIRLVNPAPGTALVFTKRDIDGLTFPSRVEFRAEVAGGNGIGEVTFTLERASRPGQTEYLGTDDTAPYRLFWRPPNDLAPEEKFTLTATHHDGCCQVASAQVEGLSVAHPIDRSGIWRAPAHVVTQWKTKVPVITQQPAYTADGEQAGLSFSVTGTEPMEFQWLRNDNPYTGGTLLKAGTFNGSDLRLIFPRNSGMAGRWRVLVRNPAGAVISQEVVVP